MSPYRWTDARSPWMAGVAIEIEAEVSFRSVKRGTLQLITDMGAAGHSQRAIARLAGVSQPYVSRVLRGLRGVRRAA